MRTWPAKPENPNRRTRHAGRRFGPSLVCALALLPSLVWAQLAASSLRDRANQIDAPIVAQRVTLAGPLQLGRTALTPGPQASVWLLTSGDVPCGLWIAGPAHVGLAIDDRFSTPIAKRNLRRVEAVGMIDVAGRTEVSGDLEEAVLWGWELPAQAIAAPTQGEHTGGFPAWASDLLKRGVAPPSHELLIAKGLHGTGTVYALFRTKHETLLLDVDPVEERSEALFAVRQVPRLARVDEDYFLQQVVEQPINRHWWDRFPAPLVAEHESLSVDNDEGRHVTVTSRLRLRATRPGVAMWRAALQDRVLDGGHILPVRIKSARVDGQPADALLDRSELFVALGRTVEAQQTVEVEVVSEGDLAVRPRGDSYWELGAWPWYAKPPMNGELATIDLAVRVPAPFMPFASGAILSRQSQAGFNTLQARLDRRMQFPVAAAGKYHVFSDTRDGITANVASYAGADERGCRRLINNFFAAAAFYRDLFGSPYPFTDFTVIEINSWGFGQAPPGVIFITQEAYNPLAELYTDSARGVSQGVNQRYVHEIAHGWWAHVVKMDSLDEQWLTESFAEYSSALCLQAMRGPKGGEAEFKSILNRWRARTGYIGEGGSVYLANHLAGEEDDRRDRVYLLYGKGPLVLHALRQELARRRGSTEEGDRYFFALLRSFLKNFDHKWGGTRHLIGILNQMTQQEWQPWFERYVYGTETPPIK